MHPSLKRSVPNPYEPRSNPGAMHRIAPLLALLILTGCSDDWAVALAPVGGTPEAPADPEPSPTPDPQETPPPEPTPEPRPRGELTLTPSAWDFGTALPGCEDELVVLLRNVGEAAVEVSDIAYEADSDELSLHMVPDLPRVLEAGESLPLLVRHHPLLAETTAGKLRVVSDATAGEHPQADQIAASAPVEWRSEAFVQSGDRSVDVLWVVDSSCSMAQEQEALAGNFGSFLDVVDELALDYQVGVITTDLEDGGILEGPTRWVTPDTPDAEGVFADNVLVGQTGSGLEQGFDAALEALTGDPMDPEGPNVGFLRPDAGLRIVFVSDEDDQSFGYADASEYVALLQATKTNPDHVVLSDITGGASGCYANSANADAAPRYLEATALTGGLSTTICNPGWIDTLESLGWLSDARSDTFALSEPALPDSVSVTVDGDAVAGWVYDADLQAVVFDYEAVPSEGAAVAVEYGLARPCN